MNTEAGKTQSSGTVQPDLLRIREMVFQANHGCTPAEREVGATFRVEAELRFSQRQASRTDNLEDTVDVTEVHEVVSEIILGPSCNLLETLAEKIAIVLLDRLDVESVRIRLHKNRSPLPAPTGGYEVEIVRS
ncbi:MAG: dihydroneopterin aldolase [Candidatus Electryonea clarkiae]|nr:dihydroneopterin aldolase [Candidatus Electryonea clarkiae]MDP8285317.1 dihydroneopterin aldolase [Candidatus Electryonea clarkiae]